MSVRREAKGAFSPLGIFKASYGSLFALKLEKDKQNVDVATWKRFGGRPWSQSVPQWRATEVPTFTVVCIDVAASEPQWRKTRS